MKKFKQESLKDSTKVTKLGNRFAAWTLAVLGTFSTTGAVCLRPSSAWGQEEAKPQSTESTEKEKQEEEKEAPLTASEFSKLLTAKKYDAATERLDKELAKNPNNLQLSSMDLQLSSVLSRTQPEVANKRLRAIVERMSSLKKHTETTGMILYQSLFYLTADKLTSEDEKLVMVNDAISIVEQYSVPSSLGQLISLKCRLLIAGGKKDEAKKLLEKRIELAKAQSITSYVQMVVTYQTILGDAFPDDVKALLVDAENALLEKLKSDNPVVEEYESLVKLKSREISRLVYTDPKKANSILESINAIIETASEKLDEAGLKRIESSKRTLTSHEARIKSALEREELIGTPAPEIDAEHFVGTDPLTMTDLRGKVVLLDFWAVWCAPCIATFPHLIEWHEKYSEKGLVILGATKFYGYKWDDAANRASRSEDKPSPEEELEMLATFREHHKLHHSFFVTPEKSTYNKSFYVSGIPQAVLLDKEGKIQMIRVGSTEENAKALEAKIEELLSK